MPRAVVRRWGKNLAIRLLAEVATAARLGEGERVEIVVSDDAVVIRKLPTESSVVALFAGCSPETWRALYRAAFDWGLDRGRERLDE